MDMPINTKAEGRILVPWEHLEFSNLTQQNSPGMFFFLHFLYFPFTKKNATYTDGDVKKFVDFVPDWQGQGSVWEAFRRTCPLDSPARQLYSSYRDANVQKRNPLLGQSGGSDDTIAFAKTVDDDYDFCKNPWAHYMQGHFFSDWRTISELYPVFSPAKARGFSDIRIPSHYYHRGSPRYTYAWDTVLNEVQAVDNMEVPWDQKSDLIFWRGATTGGGSTPLGFVSTYQRHRYLSFLTLSMNSLRAALQIPPHGSRKRRF